MITEKLVKKIFKECCKNAGIKPNLVSQEFMPYAFATFNKDILYNYNYILYMNSIDYIYEGFYHELGHVKYNGKYKTKKERINEEAYAIEYALKMLKKYHPEYVKPVLNRWLEAIDNIEWGNEWAIHAKAFKKIYKKYKKGLI